MIRITDILDKIYDYYPDADSDIVDRAYIFSAKVHDGQLRLSGEPYLSHPLEVASILADMRLDTTSIACGLLHDVVEDTHATVEDIEKMFGPDAAKIIEGLTKISKLSFDTAKAHQAGNIRKMILAMADDLRVILIKLADRLHNIRTLHYHKKESKKRFIAQETLDIYAPIASRLGIFWIKNELEDISFFHTHPEEYEKIKQLVSTSQTDREYYVMEVKNTIQDIMRHEGIPSTVTGRHKQYYSIYQKMISQNLDFEEVYDIIAFRIIVDTIPQCYETLGHVHSKWKPVPRKLKDYIGFPKPNGYKSLHTTVIGPYGERMEIQIRTHEMDQVANSGIAAHWSYKEGKTLNDESKSAFAWIRTLVENQETAADPDEFLENVRIDLFPKDIYVFTPTGEVKNLPKGSTPVDFAYMIHSEVGNQCSGAKINGRLRPLQHQLQTGDTVEIITFKGHHPSADWLTFVKTGKARSRIQQWIKKQETERSISLGREMCDKAFRKHKLNFSELVNTKEMAAIAQEFNFKKVEDLIANIGYGKITPRQIIGKLLPDATPEKEETLFTKFISRRKEKKNKDTDGIVVDGLDDILIRFGQCCQPIPGDVITGYITHGAGITVHRQGCVNALKMNPERQIGVSWKEVPAGTFQVRLNVQAYDKTGFLAELSTLLKQMEANVVDIKLESEKNKMVNGFFTIAVKDIDHLDDVITKLKKIDTVKQISRAFP
ncbi:MAG: bifunctional (p)ppGpp synthetase/guanosine-3',5'-bis(diphosphate) 3'-pyrophosphohydrolase [Desulfobacteraceae bacterium]|nr:MAG: bifunctional (p)ppGpp synthetase/guanosine-3',5'-bis(diphosphate) 3'-pyrophosphohydrolase [Desulfobacteraceae bacterium]